MLILVGMVIGFVIGFVLGMLWMALITNAADRDDAQGTR